MNLKEKKVIKLSKQAKKDYVEYPHECPYCKSENIDAGPMDASSSNEISCNVKCLCCNKSWTEYYLLNRIEEE